MRTLRPALTVLLLLILWQLGWADDCSSPEDAMDTIWLGPPLKGLMSAVIAVAVNGRTIMTKLLTQPGGQKDQKVPSFRLNVATQSRRTQLELDSSEGLWVYAWIQAVDPPPGYDAAAATAAIGVSGEDCLELGSPQMLGARKAVYVKAVTPGSGAPPAQATMTFTATLAGYPVAAPVVFTLGSGYRLEVRTESEWGGLSA